MEDWQGRTRKEVFFSEYAFVFIRGDDESLNMDESLAVNLLHYFCQSLTVLFFFFKERETKIEGFINQVCEHPS